MPGNTPAKGTPPQPFVQDNTANNVADLQNQLAAEKLKQQDTQMAAALASAQTPAQQQVAAQYGTNGQAGVAPPQPYPQCLPQANGQAQLSPEEEQRQQLASKERELAFSSRFASNLASSCSQEQARSQQANSQAQAVPVARSPYAAALAGGDGSSFTPARAAGEAPATPSTTPKRAAEVNVNSADGQP